MTRLDTAIADYLALRRALGFKLRHQTWWLPDFLRFLHKHGRPVITTKLALAWAQQPSMSSAAYRARRLAAIRDFARYQHARDGRTEIPPDGLISFRKRRRRPYLFTDTEIVRVLHHMRQIPKPLQAATYTTLTGLLAVTGMRVGEAIGIDRADVDWARAVITIRHGKFGKSRLVPVHASTLSALEAYARIRDQRLPHPRRASFFLSTAGTQLHHQNFHRAFLLVIRAAAIGAPHRQPCIHDLRHSFAVKTLRDWYRRRVDVEAHLPRLATYLGHVNPSSTYWYLTATPELLALAGKRLERAWEARL